MPSRNECPPPGRGQTDARLIRSHLTGNTKPHRFTPRCCLRQPSHRTHAPAWRICPTLPGAPVIRPADKVRELPHAPTCTHGPPLAYFGGRDGTCYLPSPRPHHHWPRAIPHHPFRVASRSAETWIDIPPSAQHRTLNTNDLLLHRDRRQDTSGSGEEPAAACRQRASPTSGCSLHLGDRAAYRHLASEPLPAAFPVAFRPPCRGREDLVTPVEGNQWLELGFEAWQ